MSKRKNNSLVVMVLLMVALFSCSYISGTYAKYTSTLSGKQGTAAVAKWAFDTDNSTITLDINLAETYDESTLVEGKIAPGTEGSFDIKLSNGTSEVGVDYTVSFTNVSKPTNLKFYTDNTYATELDLTDDDLTGQIAVGETVTRTVYWKWVYYTSAANDTTDTTEGKAADDLTLTMNITGVQTTPSNTAITTH